jgi:hypothetical protein
MGQERASNMLSAAAEQNVVDTLDVFNFFKEHVKESDTCELSEDATPVVLATKLVKLLAGEPTGHASGFGFLGKVFEQALCQGLGGPAQRRLQRLHSRQQTDIIALKRSSTLGPRP